MLYTNQYVGVLTSCVAFFKINLKTKDVWGGEITVKVESLSSEFKVRLYTKLGGFPKLRCVRFQKDGTASKFKDFLQMLKYTHLQS